MFSIAFWLLVAVCLVTLPIADVTASNPPRLFAEIDAPVVNMQFGSAVAVSGRLLAVGAFGFNSNTGPDCAICIVW